MVTFILIEKTENTLTYYYYPEGYEDKEPGIIIIYIKEQEAEIVKLAELDFERDIYPEESNLLVDAINECVRERGGTDFVEPVTKVWHSTFFADHVIRKIFEALGNGKVLEEGQSAWY